MHMRSIFFLALVLAASAAAAQDAPKSVTLSQAELQAIVDAEATKAVANYVANEAQAKAKAAYDKVKAAFAPPAPEQPH